MAYQIGRVSIWDKNITDRKSNVMAKDFRIFYYVFYFWKINIIFDIYVYRWSRLVFNTFDIEMVHLERGKQ